MKVPPHAYFSSLLNFFLVADLIVMQLVEEMLAQHQVDVARPWSMGCIMGGRGIMPSWL